jgi:hypothetical protein
MMNENQNQNENQNADIPQFSKSDHASRSERSSRGNTSVAGSGSQISNQKSEISEPKAPSRPRRTPHRRMRRRSSLNQKSIRESNFNREHSVPEAKSEIKNQKSETCGRPRRQRALPFQILPEFAQLSAADLAEVHNVIRDVVVPDAQKFIFQRHGISLSGHCLYRYRSRLHLADQLQVSEDNAPAIQNLLGLLAGKPVDLDKAGIHIIKQRAVGLAANPDSSPSLLKDLFRIFTYNDRLGLQQRRVKCHERMTKLAERRQKFVEKTHKNAKKKSDWRKTSAAVLKAVGDLPPIIPWTPPLKNPGERKINTNFPAPPSQPDAPTGSIGGSTD